ncbi:DUF637 domain-containing protein [Variovorax soli]|uniref:DUF637 domain-containing protein n=1 Tax=Variovorax soli TaxID=376815 RepID=UPI00286A833F|nr:DUF637 domain-containing protein [Variovorax soli]
MSNTAGGLIGAEPVPETPVQPGTGTSDSTTADADTGTGTGTSASSATGTGSSSGGATASPGYVPAPGHITAAGSILNEGGHIYAGGAVQLDTPQVNNNGGTLSTTSLAASGPSFSNAGGTLDVAGSFSARVDRFDNTGGTVRAASLQIASTGDLVNQDGQLESRGDAHLSAGSALSALRGTLRAAGDATLQGASVDLSSSATIAANIALSATQDDVLTSGATIATPGTLSVTARNQDRQSLVNQGGKLNAGQLNLNVSNLANTQGGEIVQTGTGAMNLVTSGTIDNSGGRIATNGQGLTLRATGIDNPGGKIEHAGAGTLTIAGGSYSGAHGEIIGSGALIADVAGSFNQDGGSTSARQINVHAASLSNDAGRITAAEDLSAIVTGAASNRSGTLAANGNTTLNAASFDNNGGTVAAVNGQLNLATNGTTTNIGGSLQAGGATSLRNGGLDNTVGKVFGDRVEIDTRGQALTNAQGTIAGFATVNVASGVLNNNAGLIQSGAAMVIDTHGAGYDNRGGQTQAAGDLRIDAGTVDNTGGLVRSSATTTLSVSAGSLANTATMGSDQGIEGRHVAISTRHLVNTSGAIRADIDTAITSTGRVDNMSGLISAGDTLSIADPNAATPAAKTLAVENTAGTLLAGKALVVDAGALTLGGKLLSQGDMHLALVQNVVIAAGSETLANRDLSLDTHGDISNKGKLAAGNALLLGARNIDNAATGDLRGSTTRLNASGTVTNRGIIDGAVTRIDANTLTNIGTGRIYGDRISIGAGTLNNLSETGNGLGSAATLAARERLDIGAQAINNRDAALIFSDGDLAIGGSLDANGRATGVAATLNNHAATIEATGNAEITTNLLNNTNGGVTWTLQPGTRQHIVEYALPGGSQRWKDSEVLFGAGGTIQFPDTGWNSWTAIPASDPLLPGSNAGARLLVPSPDYPLERFRSYYLRSPANSADRSHQNCTGGNATVCETTASPGAWYARTDTIWATFGLTPPEQDLPADFIGRKHPDITVGQEGITVTVDGPSGPTSILQPFDHPVTQAEYDQWQAYRQAHQKLDEATVAFITTMTGVVNGPTGESKPPRFSSLYDAYDYTVASSQPVLQSSAPAKILAGGAMKIQVASGVNDMSQILAGGALIVTGGQIANRALTVDAPTEQTGIAIHSYIKEHTSSDDERLYQIAPYDLTTHSTVTLAAARQEGYAAVAGSGAGIGTLTVGRTGAAAQGSGAVQAGSHTNAIVQVPSAAGGAAVAASRASLVVRTSAPDPTLPAASLFASRPEAGSRYLVETDPRFANHRQWLSSDYLLDNLGLDPNITQKRLGDGFYEQRLIREQVAQLTGHRFLDGFQDDDAQYAALMNAGATFAGQYDLRVGIALTDAQMAQLTSDIVWLIEREVRLPDGSTQRVLVPQVYVRVKEDDLDGSGALLAGSSLDMRLTGDLINAGGTIAGRRLVRIDAGNVSNLGGRIHGDDVGIQARTDLDNIAGVIDARSSLDLMAGRDLNVLTTTRDSRSGARGLPGLDAASGVKLAAVTVDRVAGLYVTDPGGSLLAEAGRDVNLIGAEVDSAGDARLSAGRDMNIAAVITGRSEDIRWSARNSRRETQSQETGSTVRAIGNVSLTAGRDLSARAATLRAGKNLSLDAGNQLSLLAGENTLSAETHHASKEGMAQYSLDADSRVTALSRTTLNAADIRLGSGADMTLGAIEADARRLDMEAGGQLNLPVQSTTQAASRRENDSDAAFASASGSGMADETSRYSRFNVLALTIKAAGGVNAQIGQRDSFATLGQQPGMGWVNQLTSDPALIDSTAWQRVKEAHERWAYHQSGMGPVTAAVVSLVAGVATAGAGTAAVGSSFAAAYPATTAAVQAGITSMASQAAVSLANNGGDIGRVLQELGSSDGVRSIATSIVTAELIQGLGTSGVLPAPLANATNGSALFTDQLQRQLIDGAASAMVRSAINGTSLEGELRDGLASALLNTAAAQGAFEIGESGPQGSQRLNAFAAEVAHAIVGCAVGAGRTGSDDGCAPGALGAVAGHLVAQYVNPTGDPSRSAQTIEASRLFGGIAAAIAGGDERAIYIATGSATTAVENNELLHLGSHVAAMTRSGYTLERIALPGYGDAYVDPRLATALQDWIDQAAAAGVSIHFNSAFRISGQPVAGAVYPPAGGSSLHNAGLAVDIRYDRLQDIPGGLTGDQQRAILRSTAASAGLSWGGNFANPDNVHFFIDPYGSPNPGRGSLINIQQDAYQYLNPKR